MDISSEPRPVKEEVKNLRHAERLCLRKICDYYDIKNRGRYLRSILDSE